VDLELLESFGSRERGGFLLTLRDAESRRQIGAQLDVAARLTAISRITGSVAHEIKNPLSAITLHLEVIKAKLQAGMAEVSTELDVISREITRLDRVVKTFLDFTRPVELRWSAVDLNEIASEAAALVQPQAARQRVIVEVAQAPGRAIVQGDRDLIKQAALNLVVNGVEAMKDGGRLNLTVRQSSEWLELLVEDTGPGIPDELRSKIFQLYFTTKPKGSGIGLAFAFRVAHLHGGAIDFSTEPGEGTVFRLRFPSAQEARS
jgi:signal transduction histidine kinase